MYFKCISSWKEKKWEHSNFQLLPPPPLICTCFFTCTTPSTYVPFSELPPKPHHPSPKKVMWCSRIFEWKIGEWKERWKYFFCKHKISIFYTVMYTTTIKIFKNVCCTFLMKNAFICWTRLKTAKLLATATFSNSVCCLKNQANFFKEWTYK